ncbi:MAG: hypothetical protein LBT33_11330 [Spirochaetia bacterium]|jgi:hypothetical protein|nr:hypothetical protein [Spirochaetia bacterium]
MKTKIGVVFVSVAFFLFSCASTENLWAPVDAAVGAGDFQGALAAIDAGQAAEDEDERIYTEGNQISLQLDKGILKHYAGDFQASYDDLGTAERLIEEAYAKSVTAEIATYIVNDNSRDYAGEDYEDVYVNVFNALNAYHLNNGQAYALINDLVQAGGELQVLNEKYSEEASGSLLKTILEYIEEALKAAGATFSLGTVKFPESEKIEFTNSALARYLGAVFALTDGNKDMARFQLFELQNAYKTPIYGGAAVPKALQVSGNRGDEKGPLLDIPSGKGQLNVLAFAGLSPLKEEQLKPFDYPMQAESLKTATLKLPTLTARPSKISGVSVAVEGGASFDLEPLEDIGAVMVDTFKGHYSATVLKTFVRTLVKYIVADIAVQAAVAKGTPAFLAGAAAVAAKEGLDATEGADVRAARYLPGKAYVGAIDLDPGTYTVTVNYNGAAPVQKTVEVKAGVVSLVEAISLD